MAAFGRHLNLLREFSVPLVAGVASALLYANADPRGYAAAVFSPLVSSLSLHFLTNELFMVFFFAIAAVEITESFLPGGDLNPPARALNPLLATLGGVVGPVGVYLLLNSLFGSPELARGWGIPTATDIALAWLAARFVLGANHPALAYLILLAVADDAVGLVIIALFYPNPALEPAPAWLLLTLLGVGVSYLLRRAKVMSYWPYLLLGGSACWLGLHEAHLHPALALVFVVPFLPHAPREDKHLFEESPRDHAPLERFEAEWKVIVDFGLFFFGFCNAGVEFASVGTGTWIVLGSLALGKTAGIFCLARLGAALGLPLPRGMEWRTLLVVAMIAGIGFTVAIFVAGEAFTDPALAGQAKMGAIGSILVAPLALAFARLSGVRRKS